MNHSMFCFITSLRSRAVSDNWRRVSELFERTAVSVFNQTAPEFRLIAVCHELPILERTFDERLEFIRVNYAVPERGNREQMLDDKVLKLLLAMRRVRELGADFVMPMDADDLISRKIVAHALAHPDADGWYVEHGYRYQYGRNWLETLPGFGRICGTCNILARRWFAFPGAPEREVAADDALIVKGFGQVVETFATQGAHLRPLPFVGVVYTVLNGENTSRLVVHPQNSVRRNRLRALAGHYKRATLLWLKRRPCTPALRREFAIDSSPL